MKKNNNTDAVSLEEIGNTPAGEKLPVVANDHQPDNLPEVYTDPSGTRYIPSLAEEFSAGTTSFISGFVDDGTIETKAQMYNALNNNDGAIADLADKHEMITVTNFLIYPVEVVTEDGELVPAKRTVLVAEDGKTYGSVAEGVFKSMQGIVQFIGMAPWTPGIKIQPFRSKTRRGFYILQLRVVTS